MTDDTQPLFDGFLHALQALSKAPTDVLLFIIALGVLGLAGFCIYAVLSVAKER